MSLEISGDRETTLPRDRLTQIQELLDELNELFHSAIRQVNEGSASVQQTNGMMSYGQGYSSDGMVGFQPTVYAHKITDVSKQIEGMIDSLPARDGEFSEESLTRRLVDASEASKQEAQILETYLDRTSTWLDAIRTTMEQLQKDEMSTSAVHGPTQLI